MEHIKAAHSRALIGGDCTYHLGKAAVGLIRDLGHNGPARLLRELAEPEGDNPEIDFEDA